jgi:quercetin dioxygenase-like cupin family protein
MSRKRGAAAVLAALIAVVVISLNALPSAAQESPPPIASEPLTSRAVFPDDVNLKVKIKLDGHANHVVNVDDPSRTAVVKFTVQPGAQFPWHTHAGPVFVNIISGALTYIPAETCARHTYTAGQAFVDPGQGHVHSAVNETSAPTIFIATFFDAPAEGPLVIPAEPADC